MSLVAMQDAIKSREVDKLFYIHRVTATAGPVVYGAAKTSAKKRNVVYSTQCIHNGQASSTQITVEGKIKHMTTATWHVERGFSYSGSVKANARILIVYVNHKQKISLDLEGGYREQVSDTDTFSLHEVVTVPPMKSVKIDWVITETVTKIPWTSTVTATGEIAIKYKEKLEGGFLWYYNLFNLQDSRLTDAGNNMFLYTAKGTFTGVRSSESLETVITEYNNQTCRGRSSALKTYTIPSNPIPHTPATKT
ncbi:uncharacterized protein LOC120839491 [Ixodes scapularis]|uniref:uncharacterized protein LOC120839491 n=1 Tax=Ixodes scapularis TaxID=6945 RepID=UPI001A9FA922|nr:uncharacterized protein LOC120839491 [Ixodes scapularis]